MSEILTPTLNPTIILGIFYVIFLSQIFLLSLYYPHVIADRVKYVMTHFPHKDYPNLYPNYHEGYEEKIMGRMKIYKIINMTIAAFGLYIIGYMFFTNYTPSNKGGDEIFVMFYFFLQFMPIMIVQVTEMSHYRNMQKHFKKRVRKAELTVRKLSDFISPIYVLLAVVLYFVWAAYFLSDKGPISTWEIEVFAALTIITLVNIAYGCFVANIMYGKKLDPYKSSKDQQILIKTMAYVMVFSSILISLFMTLTQFLDTNDLEVFDPPLMSFYMQMCAVFGLGLSMKNTNIKDMDFEVYKEEAEEK